MLLGVVSKSSRKIAVVCCCGERNEMFVVKKGKINEIIKVNTQNKQVSV
jgi:predicted component of viral defense system (DUF524 family)